MKKMLCLPLFLLIFAAAAFADIRLPDTPTPKPTPKIKSADATLIIKLDQTATDATLIVPKNQLARLRAQLDDLDGAADPGAASVFTRAQTIVSGAFLSLAVIFGGVWTARRRKSAAHNRVIAAGALLLLLTGAAATVAFANAGPPAVLRTISGQLFNKDAFRYWNSARGSVKVQLARDDDGAITLVVPDAKDGKRSGE